MEVTSVETHGLDLERIQRENGGHSIFAPSASALWLNSPGCLIPNVLAPDSAGEDAAYGTVGHDMGEKWLRALPKHVFGLDPDLVQPTIDEAEPRQHLGEVRIVKERDREFEIEIDQEMLDYVRKYVEWCVSVPGEHYTEVRVDFSDLTPIPNQGGTSDDAACSPGLLVITDLKMGKGVKVYAEGNTQLRLYAYGFFRQFDALYNFERIVIRIAQPRLEHFDEWKITREELLDFAFNEVRPKAAEAWALNGDRRPGWWCKKAFCKVMGTCGAWLNWIDDQDGGVFDAEDTCMVCEGLGCDLCQGVVVDEDGVIEGQFYTVEERETTEAALLTGKLDPTPRRDPGGMSTEAMARLLKYRPVIEKWFEQMERELESRAIDGETIPGWKLVQGRAGRRSWLDEKEAVEVLTSVYGVPRLEVISKVVTPAAAADLVRKHLGGTKKSADHMLESLVKRPPARQTLAPDNDERQELSTDDVFDLVDDDL